MGVERGERKMGREVPNVGRERWVAG